MRQLAEKYGGSSRKNFTNINKANAAQHLSNEANGMETVEFDDKTEA